ncbi:MAG: 50S ribosomal protein L17 [Ignavibacteriae bacterium HGW-Ignavibacteriae-3]|nr:MAG: 50S ribosomal protein L17 [Ignavibacteriae bacterium HGW-Ignavibacteriae-3]
MRHGVKGKKLGRTASHRLATLKVLATSLLQHKKIKTTAAKAKALRGFVEPIITKAKTDSVHARRYVAEKINDRAVVSELFAEIVPKIGERPGGYTRVVHLGQRKGDGAHMAIIELVDYSGVMKPKAPKKVKGEEAPVETPEEVKAEEKKEKKTKAAKKTAAPKPKKEKAPKEKVTKEKKVTKTTKSPQKKGS